ncbi:NUDIX hydrolase [bacterium]|nr:NUDIX hydrolase [bacterium]
MSFLKQQFVKASLALVFAAHHARRFILRRMGEEGVRSVRVLLIRDGRVLLVRHWYAPGVMMLPGGGIKRGEKAEDAARREIKEETGFDLDKLELLGEYEGNYPGDSVTVFFASEFDGYVRLMPNKEIMLRSFKKLTDAEDMDELAPDSKRRILSYNAGARGERGKW